jgi:hypothetical protein
MPRRLETDADVDDYGWSAPAAVDPPHEMHQLAQTLVARPRQAQPLRLTADPPRRLGDRHLPVVEADERLEEARRDAGSNRRHSSECGVTRLTNLPRLRAIPAQVTVCY